MAIKSKLVEESDDEEEEDNDDEELAMFSRRFKWSIRKKKSWKKNREKVSKEEFKKEFKKDLKKDSKKDTSIICYKYNKLGHMKQDCPLVNKYSKYSKKKKEKAMKATWSDSDDNTFKEEDDLEEMENLCLMAIEENAS